MRKIAIGLGVVLVIGVGGYGMYEVFAKAPATAPAAATPGEAPRGARPQPVVAMQAKHASVPLDIVAIGSVFPAETVQVKSRIDGEIVKINFKEGDEVKAGDLLVQLDSRQIEAQLRQAQATLARDRASMTNARREVERLRDLASKDFVTKQKFDQTQTDAAVFEANVKADEAAVENLQVQITYTSIKSPINGRTGAINLTRGNTVKANDTVNMFVINQIRPINVRFAVPQKYFGTVREAMNKGPIEVFATIPGPAAVGGTNRVAGKLGFLDNNIDSATGTFQVRAQFPNENMQLWPGMFVDVVIRLGIEADVLTVPTAAIQNGQQGSYVFVVKPDNTTEIRPVKVAREAGDQTILETGIKDGETVVTEGQLRLGQGTKVEVRTNAAAAAAPAKQGS